MPSIVTICNMALSHIGAMARVSSIDPPDGSVEAGHCANYYDQARTEMLEAGNWAFSLKRAPLALTPDTNDGWAFVYSLPSDCLSARRIPVAHFGRTVFDEDDARYQPNDLAGADFTVEGRKLHTNEVDAVLLYVTDVTDTTKFTPSFTSALSYLLASYLAGPIMKGNEGARMAEAMRQRATAMAAASAATSANASSALQEFLPSSLAARR